MNNQNKLNNLVSVTLWASTILFIGTGLLTLVALIWNEVQTYDLINEEYLSRLFTTIIIAVGAAGATAFGNALMSQIRNSKTNNIQIAAVEMKDVQNEGNTVTREYTIYGTNFSSSLDAQINAQIISANAVIIGYGQAHILRDSMNRWKVIFRRDIEKNASETLTIQMNLISRNGKQLAIDNYSFSG